MWNLVMFACLALECSSIAIRFDANPTWSKAIECFEHVSLTTVYYNCAKEAFLNQRQTLRLWGCFKDVTNRVAQIAGSCLIEYGGAGDLFRDPCFWFLNVTFPYGATHLQSEPRNESRWDIPADFWQSTTLSMCAARYFGLMFEGAKACEASCKQPNEQQTYAVKACKRDYGDGGFFSKHPEVAMEGYACVEKALEKAKVEASETHTA